MKDKIARFLPVYLKGMAMGAADVVPGVSGGTIAFISGIYEHLISSIRSIDLEGFKILFSKGLPAFWKRIDGWFLSTLFVGILTSVLSLARLISYLLENEPIGLWSFFFGLVLASAIAVGFKIKRKNALALFFFVIGSGIAWWIGTITPAETPENLPFIFLSGAIAICAMILPGISGSFILLLLRKYHFILDAVLSFNLPVILVFMAGCLIGLISFAKLLGFLFRKFHDATIALMIGFMIGSLPVVWPWKNVIETRIDSKGDEVPFLYESVLPRDYAGEPQILIAVLLAIFGFGLILFIENRFNRSETV
jgi:putative membrane protein